MEQQTPQYNIKQTIVSLKGLLKIYETMLTTFNIDNNMQSAFVVQSKNRIYTIGKNSIDKFIVQTAKQLPFVFVNKDEAALIAKNFKINIGDDEIIWQVLTLVNYLQTEIISTTEMINSLEKMLFTIPAHLNKNINPKLN